MKLLLDENLPKKLKNDFSEYFIHTVSDMLYKKQTIGVFYGNEKHFYFLLSNN